jgi:hypothetical protein
MDMNTWTNGTAVLKDICSRVYLHVNGTQLWWAVNTAVSHIDDEPESAAELAESFKNFEWGWLVQEVCMYNVMRSHINLA